MNYKALSVDSYDFRKSVVGESTLAKMMNDGSFVVDLDRLILSADVIVSPSKEVSVKKATGGIHLIKAGISIEEAFTAAMNIARVGRKDGPRLTHPPQAMMVTFIAKGMVQKNFYWNFNEQILKTKIEPGDILQIEPGL